MVHWSEHRPREHSHEDFPPHDLKPVRAFVAIRMNQQVEDAVSALSDSIKRPRDGMPKLAGPPHFCSQLQNRLDWLILVEY